jgi:hypothetical protein
VLDQVIGALLLGCSEEQVTMMERLTIEQQLREIGRGSSHEYGQPMIAERRRNSYTTAYEGCKGSRAS